MKLFKNILIFILFTLVGFGGLYTFLSSNPQIKTVTLKEIFKGSKFSLLEAPSLSLKANVTNARGKVLWQSRISENAIEVNSLSNIQQGEGIETGEDGYLELNFPDVAKIIINENSKIDIAQTIPNDLVFSQTDGIVDYQKLSTIPVSVRSKRLLVEVLGDTKIGVKDDLIEITGNAKIAYNNNANITKLLEVPAGKTLIFNNQSLKVVVK